MKNQDIVKAILSKDAGRIAEAKTAIKASLDARATQFRSDSTKFIAQSLFETTDGGSMDMVDWHERHAEYHQRGADYHKHMSGPEHGHAHSLALDAVAAHNSAAQHHRDNSPNKRDKSFAARDAGNRATKASMDVVNKVVSQKKANESVDESFGGIKESSEHRDDPKGHHEWMTAYHTSTAQLHDKFKRQADRATLHRAAAGAHAAAFAAHRDNEPNKHELSDTAAKHTKTAEDATWKPVKKK